jgi:hypothetical protein
MEGEHVDDLVAAYRSGDSVPELASKFGVNETTVRAHLSRREISTRGNGGYRKVHGDQLDRAQKLYAAGSSLRSVASELGCLGRQPERAWSHLDSRFVLAELQYATRNKPPPGGGLGLQAKHRRVGNRRRRWAGARPAVSRPPGEADGGSSRMVISTSTMTAGP